MRVLVLLLSCCVVWLGAWPALSLANPVAAATTATAEAEDWPVRLMNRHIVSFRVPLGGDSPAQRAAMAQEALHTAAASRGPHAVTTVADGAALRFEVDGTPVFYLVAEDLGQATHSAMLQAGARKVATRLVQALQAAREQADPKALAWAAGRSGLASVLALSALWLLWRGRRRAHAGWARWGRQLQARVAPATPWAALARALPRLLGGLGLLLLWLAVLLLLELWGSYVLQQFPFTRPWGEALSHWLRDLLARFALGIAGALPGLATALLIFALARLVTGLVGMVAGQVERGELSLGWVDEDTAGPTRRVVNLLVWLFALALAYPHLPGANSDSFKGVSVLAGLMLSLGASGVVGQAVAGMTLMYARALRVGEYVKIGDTEGTVTALGLFTTRVHTGMGEEVSLPNAHVMGQPVRNFSRLVGDGRFVLHTAVTIGYATPWRQVHAMLLEAARRPPGIGTEPAPYVVQTALSDFYVEYRLCCQALREAPQRRAEAMSALLANVQDVFNENGVQIMSPHYRSDPPELQVVPPGPWAPAAGGPLQPPAPPDRRGSAA